MSLITTPHRYQRHGARLIDYFDGRAWLADDPGLGKSLQALLYWQWFLKDDKGPVVIICPANIKTNWKREVRKHLGLGSTVLYGRTPEDDGQIDLGDQVYIINYDILGKAQPPGTVAAKRREKSWANYLLDLHPKLVIVDEIHMCRNRGTQRSKAVKNMMRAIPHAVAISGTPIINRPAELWAPANMLWPSRFPNFVDFAFEYCNARKVFGRWEYKGHRNLDKLHALLGEIGMIRRRKADVLSQLPPKTRTVVPLDLDDHSEYDRAVADFLAWRGRAAPYMDKTAERQQQMSQISDMKRLAGQLKVPSVIRWVEDFLELTGEKLLLFAWHVESVIEKIGGHFGKQAAVLHGSVPMKDRQRATDRFNDDPSCRLMVANIQAGGVGWSCRSTSNVAFAELAWTPGEHLQAEDRIHGLERGVPGAKAMIHYLVASGTIEEQLCRSIQAKQAVLDQAIDGGGADDGIDIYNLLAKHLEKTNTRTAGKGKSPNPYK